MLEAKAIQQRRMRALVRGAYDIQKLRISTGNRFVGNFKAKLGQAPGEKEDTLDAEDQTLLAEIREHNVKIASAIAAGKIKRHEVQEKDQLKAGVTDKLWKAAKKSFKKIVENGKPPKKPKDFKGDPIISDFTEYSLMSQYVDLEMCEARHMSLVKAEVRQNRLWKEWLLDQPGCGETMAGVILSEIRIDRSDTVSQLWAYCGLDVVQNEDGSTEGRSKKAHHLVDREYVNRDGKKETKKSITYNPWLKTKLVGVLGDCFMRTGGKWKDVYDGYRHRMNHHAIYGEHNDVKKGKKRAEGQPRTSALRRHRMAIRYMVKQFLLALYLKWRVMEGLPIRASYAEEKLGRAPHGGNEVDGGQARAAGD